MLRLLNLIQQSPQYYKHINRMSYRSIQLQVDELFDRADHANISHKDDGPKGIRKLPLQPKQSIDIMKDVLEAIIYVSSHLIIYKPCQVFKEHIIEKRIGRWGLCNIICYRDPNQQKQFSPDRYYPMDYEFHPDEDSQLAWSLGRLWYQLLTDSAIPPIKSLTQQQLDTLLQTSGIHDLRIVYLLKQILVIDKNNRCSLDSLIKHGLFEYQQKSRIYLHSVIPNLSRVQQMSKLITNTNKFENKISFTNYNPFEEELFKRDFKQAVIIADLFEKVKKFIFNSFEIQQKNNQIDFSCYLIDLVSYLRLNNFRLKREENQYLIVLLYDKSDYTHYLQRVLELEGKIQRKRKMNKFNQFRKQFPQLLDSPSNFTKQHIQKIYYHFKTYLMSYAKHFRDQKMKKNQGKQQLDAKSYASLIQILLVRASNYVFANCRKYVFGDFLQKGALNLRKVLENVSNCNDLQKLKKLQKTIFDLYFPPGNSNSSRN